MKEYREVSHVGALEEIPETYRAPYDRFVEKYELDREESYSVVDLKEILGWKEYQPELSIRPYRSSERSIR